MKGYGGLLQGSDNRDFRVMFHCMGRDRRPNVLIPVLHYVLLCPKGTCKWHAGCSRHFPTTCPPAIVSFITVNLFSEWHELCLIT